jgi:hypothetical protein
MEDSTWDCDEIPMDNEKAKVVAVCVSDQMIMRMTDTSIKVIAKHNPNATASTLLAAPL